MRNVDAAMIENALSNYGISGQKPAIAFTPFPDNKTAFGNTTDRAVRGLVADIVCPVPLSLLTLNNPKVC
jgi:hypothetical protein